MAATACDPTLPVPPYLTTPAMNSNFPSCDAAALSCPWTAIPVGGAAGRRSGPAPLGGRVPSVTLPPPTWEDLLGRR